MNKTRPKQLSFRVNEEEYQKLQERVQESGKNQQEYILSCVLDKKNRQYGRNHELIPELKRIGNNLNQIAKRCNEGGVSPRSRGAGTRGESQKQVWSAVCIVKQGRQRRKCRLPRTMGENRRKDVQALCPELP